MSLVVVEYERSFRRLELPFATYGVRLQTIPEHKKPLPSPPPPPPHSSSKSSSQSKPKKKHGLLLYFSDQVLHDPLFSHKFSFLFFLLLLRRSFHNLTGSRRSFYGLNVTELARSASPAHLGPLKKVVFLSKRRVHKRSRRDCKTKREMLFSF